MTRNLVTAANENLVHGFEVLSEALDEGAVESFGAVTAASSGLPIPNFNRIVVFEEPAAASLEKAVAWMAGRDVPFKLTAADPALEAVQSAADPLGIEETDTQPAMALPSLDTVPTGDPPVTVGEVATGDGLDAFVTVSASVFGFPLEMARELMHERVIHHDDLLFLVGYDDGEPVACGQLVQSGDVAGVYSIAVEESHRRRGIGTAISRAVLRRGREAGCSVGVLQSSEMGRPVYEEMGFETVVTYHDFHPAE